MLEMVRHEIERAEKAGITRYQVCKRAGVSQAVVSRFMGGTRGLGIDVVERLADALGMEVTLRAKGTRKGK